MNTEETQMVMFKLDIGLSIVIDGVECLKDEDCEHCILAECHNQVKQWLAKYGDE